MRAGELNRLVHILDTFHTAGKMSTSTERRRDYSAYSAFGPGEEHRVTTDCAVEGGGSQVREEASYSQTELPLPDTQA